MLLATLIAFMAAAGIFLVFWSFARPVQEETVADRLNQYSNKIATLEEIEMEKSLSERMIRPLITNIANTLQSRTPQKMLDDIRGKLEAAGNPNDMTVADFLGIQGFAALIAMGGSLLILSGSDQSIVVKLLGPVAGGFLGMYLPKIWLSGKISRRQKDLTLSMPDCLDLLTISVEAGMGFEQAMQTVSEKWDNALTWEFARVLREQRMGKSRREALRGLAMRCNTQELTTFTSAIIQGEQLGVSISRILQVQSEQMRLKRRQKAEKLAHEAPLKMTFPMVLFMMPALWIVILGPMWPNLAIMMGGGSK